MYVSVCKRILENRKERRDVSCKCLFSDTRFGLITNPRQCLYLLLLKDPFKYPSSHSTLRVRTLFVLWCVTCRCPLPPSFVETYWPGTFERLVTVLGSLRVTPQGYLRCPQEGLRPNYWGIEKVSTRLSWSRNSGNYVSGLTWSRLEVPPSRGAETGRVDIRRSGICSDYCGWQLSLSR